MRVVELVPRAVAEPEPPAADLFQPTEKTVPSATASTGAPERREDVVAVVPVNVRARRAVRVAVGGVAVDRKHVAARRQLRLHVGISPIGALGSLRRFFLPSASLSAALPVASYGRRRLAVVVGAGTTASP
jgi:hypothetical protein